MAAVLLQDIRNDQQYIKNLETSMQQKPQRKDTALLENLFRTCHIDEKKESICVSGKDINDIPSRYTIPPIRRHEKPVVGTFVDESIVSGFMYRVRYNGTADYMFDGNGVYLESIGQGYDKRLTFKSVDLLNNENYFWSDSNRSSGYAFSIIVLTAGERFDIFNFNKRFGTAEIISVSDDQEIITSINDYDIMEHRKEVQVNFKARFQLKHNSFVSDASAVVTIAKCFNEEKAQIQDVESLVLPSGKVFTLRPAFE